MYTIINDKKYEIILQNSFKEKLIGLMLKKEKITKIYMFKRCSMIHTFFMKQKIDVCILDKNYIIKYIKQNVDKNKIIIKKGYYTLEMPLETAKYLKENNKITIKEK